MSHGRGGWPDDHTGHCEDSSCQNHFATGGCDHCPATRISKKNNCWSNRKRCSICKSKFVELDESICDTCMITEDMIPCYCCSTPIEKNKSWIPEFKAYLCVSCRANHCKSCGRDTSLNIEGFCYECADDYEQKSFCVKCGKFKYVNIVNETCTNCNDNG